jgi:Uma2 family endonuclease
METSKTRLTADEYFALPETSEPMELLDGELVVSPTPTMDHQRIVLSLALMLSQKAVEFGVEVVISPMDVMLDDSNVVQTDILRLAPNSRCSLYNQRLSGPPELVVEILSPSTSRRDKRQKFRLYERHGIAEYWIIDPTNQFVELWHLVDGSYQMIDVFSPGSVFESPQLGTIEVNVIFKDR